MRRAGNIALEFTGPVAVLALWALVAHRTGSFYFPPLQEIGAAFAQSWLGEAAVTDVLPSLWRFAAGYLLAVVIGVALGVAIGVSTWISDAAEPVIQFLRALPPPALVPFGILVLGVGDAMKIGIIAFGALWPVLLNTVDGVRGVDPAFIDTARAYRVPAHARIRRFILPAAAPQMFAGMRTSLAIALALMIVSEMVASTNGIGFSVLEAQRTFAIPEMWAGIVLLGIVGYLVNMLFVQTERRALRWHAGVRGRENDV